MRARMRRYGRAPRAAARRAHGRTRRAAGHHRLEEGSVDVIATLAATSASITRWLGTLGVEGQQGRDRSCLRGRRPASCPRRSRSTPGSRLQVVDAQGCRLAERHGAQVARDLVAAPVGLLDHGAQLVARDVHVGLERCRALAGPVVDHAPRVRDVAQDLDRQDGQARTLDVRTGDLDGRTGPLAVVDRLLDVEVGVGLERAAGAHGGHAAREIEARN